MRLRLRCVVKNVQVMIVAIRLQVLLLKRYPRIQNAEMKGNVGVGQLRVGDRGKLSISATHLDLITVPQSRLCSPVPSLKIAWPIFFIL